MHARSNHLVPRLPAALLAAALLATVGPPALRTIAELHALLAHISLELCEVGLAVVRACGI
jgi:hypothetical protein